MAGSLSRRDVLIGGLAAAAAPAALARGGVGQGAGVQAIPIAISSGNGLRATAKAMEQMRAGADTLDAVIAGVNIVEEDPNDMSVGYGGLPNERGVVELDSCCMHGPTMRAGAVAALQNIKTPSRVAQQVMERTDHVLLVGQGALEFARMVGFEETNLLTDRARQAWLRWKTRLSKDDDWLDDEEIRADFKRAGLDVESGRRPTGTISCMALNEKGEVSGVTTTSGLAYKVPGRVGDSPIVGAGLYVDGDVGACGSTGRGEAVILSCGSRTVVENMRHGMSPEQAILDVLRRICDQTRSPRLLSAPGRPNFDVNFYAMNKKGQVAGGRFNKGGSFAVHDGKENRLVPSVWLFD
ncbi:MAG: N(4)-(beta-N-acetylglucosaminyl)-L-asparaginase [Fimbriimonadaceae bacterium]|nr:N(4)-(beta-N-acetylglucosaminyl)-L-asparaginase [Chthonomonadaceae bacterium]MCO5295553.1 N(4)-(beta-N-acetylglucosaminyl)-L-asparaginase [Fimbriimonadaceae bacterium]